MSIKCEICSNIYCTPINNALKNKDKSGKSFRDLAIEFPHFTERQIKHHYYEHFVHQNDVSTAKPATEVHETVHETAQEDFDPVNLGEMLPRIERESYEAYSKFMADGDTVNAAKCLANAIKCSELRLSVDRAKAKEDSHRADYDLLSDAELSAVYYLMQKAAGIPIPPGVIFMTVQNPDGSITDRKKAETEIDKMLTDPGDDKNGKNDAKNL